MTGLPPYQLPDQPDTALGQRETWTSYRRALELMGQGPDGLARLSAHLTEVSTRLEAETRSAISQTLLAYTASQDHLVQRSTRTPVRSPAPDRSSPPPSSPRPSALDLLASKQRWGPRLAQKLVLAEARRTSGATRE